MGLRGPKPIYGPKAPPKRTYVFTALAKRVVDAAKARCGVPESTIVEHLIRLHAGSLRADEFHDRQVRRRRDHAAA